MKTIEIVNDMGEVYIIALSIMSRAHDCGRYINVQADRVLDAYNAARNRNLRYNRVTNIMRDDRLGILSRPSDPSQWEKASLNDTREYLAREVWCNAVAQYNREVAQ